MDPIKKNTNLNQKEFSEALNFDNEDDGVDYFTIFAAFIVILITIIIILLIKKRSKSKRGILLTGLCDSGKTLLFARLLHHKFVLTQTSIKENTAEYSLDGKSVTIVDIPGHERLRNKFLDTYKQTTRGIFFVIDSQTFPKDIRDVAEFLYNILIDSVVAAGVHHILIACNKQDLPLVKNSNAIKTMLEKEINTLRVTKANQLESVDPNSKDTVRVLGDLSEPFTFSSLGRFKIEFADCFATDKDKNYKIEDLENWLKSIM